MAGGVGPAGRESRYAEAAERFGPALNRLTAAYERDADARRDLLQDIHVALWRSLSRYEGQCSLRTWVYRVAHNTAISRVVRPRAAAPTLVAIDEDLESIAAHADRDHGLDRRRALERLYALGDLMMFLAVLCVVYWFERTRADARSATLGQASCIDYYRRQLARQRDLSRDGWKVVLPFVPGLMLIIVGRAVEGRPATQVAALIVGALAALGGVLWAIARSVRRLEREIAALD